MEELRGDFLNTTLSCYFKKSSDVYIENQNHIQIMTVAMSVSMLVLCRLRLTENMPMGFPAVIAALGMFCLWFTTISAGIFHQRLHTDLTRTILDREQFLSAFANTAIFSYRTISIINNLSLVFISMLFYVVMSCAEDMVWLPIALVFGSGYRIIRVDVEASLLKQHLLEVLHECR